MQGVVAEEQGCKAGLETWSWKPVKDAGESENLFRQKNNYGNYTVNNDAGKVSNWIQYEKFTC
jgi:hypothetical protein